MYQDSARHVRESRLPSQGLGFDMWQGVPLDCPDHDMARWVLLELEPPTSAQSGLLTQGIHVYPAHPSIPQDREGQQCVQGGPPARVRVEAVCRSPVPEEDLQAARHPVQEGVVAPALWQSPHR